MAFSGYSEWWWRFGGPIEIWISYQDLARDVVKGLEPLRGGGFRTQSSAEAEAVSLRLMPDIRGGMRIAHIHVGDDVYLVNREQWADFTKGVMRDLSRKLGNAGHVSFEQLATVAAAVNNLA